MNFLPSPKILVFTLAVLATLCAGLLGYRYGEGGRQPRLAAAAADTSAAAEQHRIELAALIRERDVAQETVRQLQLSLADAQRINHADQTELALYRRIASEATPSGLSIDDVKRHDDSLVVTMIQSRGRKPISGVLRFALTRINDNQLERLILPTMTGEDDFEFDFRFFETINVPLDVANGFSPQQLEITVRPNGKAYKEFKAEFNWEDVNR